MSIVLVGLNHRTAPVDVRERLSLSNYELASMLPEFRTSELRQTETNETQLRAIRESVVLSTCNRLEVYALVEETIVGWHTIKRLLARYSGIPQDILHP